MTTDAMVGLGLRSRESDEQVREAIVGQLNTGEVRFPAKSFFVDDSIGSDTAHDGLSPDRPFKTITKGINAARCKEANSTAASIRTRNHSAWVFIAPGKYNEQLIFDATHKDKLFGIHIIGLAHGVPGKDYGVSINYDGAIDDANGVVCIQGNGNHISGLHIFCAEAIPALSLASGHMGDGNLVENCVIAADENMTYGIECGSLKGSTIRNCYIRGAVTAGIHCSGGADIYAIEGAIENNQISGDSPGILIDAGVTVSWGYRIHHNHVFAGANKGIDVNCGGSLNVLVTDNFVVTSGATTPIEGGCQLGNHTFDGTTTVDPGLAAG